MTVTHVALSYLRTWNAMLRERCATHPPTPSDLDARRTQTIEPPCSRLQVRNEPLQIAHVGMDERLAVHVCLPLIGKDKHAVQLPAPGIPCHNGFGFVPGVDHLGLHFQGLIFIP